MEAYQKFQRFRAAFREALAALRESRELAKSCASCRQEKRDANNKRNALFEKQYNKFRDKQVGFSCTGFCQKIVVHKVPLDDRSLTALQATVDDHPGSDEAGRCKKILNLNDQLTAARDSEPADKEIITDLEKRLRSLVVTTDVLQADHVDPGSKIVRDNRTRVQPSNFKDYNSREEHAQDLETCRPACNSCHMFVSLVDQLHPRGGPRHISKATEFVKRNSAMSDFDNDLKLGQGRDHLLTE